MLYTILCCYYVSKEKKTQQATKKSVSAPHACSRRCFPGVITCYVVLYRTQGDYTFTLFFYCRKKRFTGDKGEEIALSTGGRNVDHTRSITL